MSASLKRCIIMMLAGSREDSVLLLLLQLLCWRDHYLLSFNTLLISFPYRPCFRAERCGGCCGTWPMTPMSRWCHDPFAQYSLLALVITSVYYDVQLWLRSHRRLLLLLSLLRGCVSEPERICVHWQGFLSLFPDDTCTPLAGPEFSVSSGVWVYRAGRPCSARSRNVQLITPAAPLNPAGFMR